MLNSRRLIITGITHGAAAVLGWAGWAVFHISGSAESETTAASSRTRPHHADGAKSAEEILAIISPKKSGSSELSPAQWKSREDDFKSEFAKLVKTMPVPPDLAAALEDELKPWKKGDEVLSARMAVLMYQWATTDLPGLLNWMGEMKDDPKVKAVSNYLATVLQQAISDKGLDSVLPFFSNSQWGSSAIASCAATMGAIKDPGLMAEFKDKLAPTKWEEFKGYLSFQWPWNDKSKLVALAVAENQPELLSMLARVQRDDASGAGAWILELMRDETLDAGFREKLSKESRIKDLALANPKLPMDERIALMQGGAANASPDQRLYDDLATTDVAKQFVNGRDWSFEFRHGNVDANEVLETISNELSQTNSKAPDALRKAVFMNLIEEDSGRAMELLDNLSPDDRAKAVIDAVHDRFFSVSPDLFLTALQQVPTSDPQLWEARLDAWVRHGPDNYQRLDADYVSWVRALPDGVDRDMALYSLALAASKDNPSLSDNLRSEVKNDDLKRRISKTP